MSDHPEDLLTEYVDGTLDPVARARLEKHLSDCDSCRQEVALAREARARLAVLPEPEPPEGLGLPALRESRARRRAWGRAGAIAAAAIVAGGVVAGGVLVISQSRTPSGGVGAGAGRAAPQGPPRETPAPGPETVKPDRALSYSETAVDYDLLAIARLGDRLRNEAPKGVFRSTALAAESSEDAPAEVLGAVECVRSGLPLSRGAVPFWIEAAKFQGRRAYVAGVRQRPAAGRDRLLLVAVARDDCSLLYFAADRL